MTGTRRTDRDMLKIVSILFCFAAVFVFGAGSALGADQPPPGTYTKTCRNINYSATQNKILNASCKTLKGSWKPAQFSNVSQCLAQRGDIENCNGTIECTRVGIPSLGSYRQSCFCCRMVGTTLSCYCITKKNVSRWTSLANAGSYGSIWNDNGVLKGTR